MIYRSNSLLVYQFKLLLVQVLTWRVCFCTHLPAHLVTCLLANLFTSQFVYQSTWLAVNLLTCLLFYLSTCLPFYLYSFYYAKSTSSLELPVGILSSIVPYSLNTFLVCIDNYQGLLLIIINSKIYLFSVQKIYFNT